MFAKKVEQLVRPICRPSCNSLILFCRVRDWRDIGVERDSFPAPPHKNCS